MQGLDINQILDMIPHRYPFLLVDRVTETKAGEYIKGIKNITANEPQFMGHFPGRPIMPGVLIVEAIAQLSAILVAESMKSKDLNLNKETSEIYFMSIDNAKFRQVVLPGDRLEMHSKIERNRGFVWRFAASASVDDKIVAEATITAMIKSKQD